MNKLVCLLFIAVCWSCTHNSGTEKHQGKRNNTENLICNPIPYPDLLGITMQLLKSDSLLLLNDFRGDSLIHVFDVKNNRLLTKLFSVGNGPNELISPLAVYIREHMLYIYYRQATTLYSIPLDSLLYKNKRLKKHFQLSNETNLLFPLSDSLFIASGFSQKRYALFNCWGEKVSEFGEYPAYWSRESHLPVRVKAMFHQTGFERHPTEACFLSYSTHTIEIYDYGKNNNPPVLIKSLLMGKYDYSYMDDGTYLSTEKGPDVERGIMSVASSSDYIYIVYNLNKTIDNSLGTQIRIIDWKGNPVKVLNFDKEITCLTVDEKEKKAYVIVEDPNDTLMYFVI